MALPGARPCHFAHDRAASCRHASCDPCAGDEEPWRGWSSVIRQRCCGSCATQPAASQADFVNAGIIGENGALEDFVAIGLDEAMLGALRRSIEGDSSHPARAVLETRRVIRGHSYLFVPVASPSRIYGWLGLVDKKGGQTFSDEDAEVGSALGALAGVAYENSRVNSQLLAQAEQLPEHEKRIHFAMSAARTGVSYRDLDSSWVEVSRSMAELFGLSPHVRRVRQDDLYERVHPDDAPLVRAAIEQAIAEPSDFAIEFRRTTANEDIRWFQFRGRVVSGEAGEPLRVVGVTTDITERRKLGLETRQSQKMEALEQLAGGVSHEFNNLLTAILGYSRFALDAAHDASQRHDLDEIVKAASRAAALTKQLLAFSRRHIVETTVFDLNLIVADVVDELRQMIGNDIELATSLAEGLGNVRADCSQLEQVVMNLVINASDACGPGGRIRLATAAVDVDESIASRVPGLNAGGYVTLSVSDNGSGMNEATKARLFEPFFTTKPRGQGSGLGLATVYGIVVQSGGAIEVDSEPGRGSTFTVYLPRVQEMSPSAGRLVHSPPAMGTRTVLLVEDEPAVRELVRTILERAGYHVVDAASAEDAIARFNAMPPVDLLLTDVVMPGMSGFELFHALIERTPSLRVLFVSGYIHYTSVEPAMTEKGTAFLEKPFSAEALVRKVRELFNS